VGDDRERGEELPAARSDQKGGRKREVALLDQRSEYIQRNLTHVEKRMARKGRLSRDKQA